MRLHLIPHENAFYDMFERLANLLATGHNCLQRCLVTERSVRRSQDACVMPSTRPTRSRM